MPDDRRQVQPGLLNADFAGFDLRDVQQVVDDARQAVEVVLRGLQDSNLLLVNRAGNAVNEKADALLGDGQRRA